MRPDKFLLAAILICLSGSRSSSIVIRSHGFFKLNQTAGPAVSSAVAAELRAIVAKGHFGDNLNAAGYREQVKEVYEFRNFAPLWISGVAPTSQATYLIEAFGTSRQKGLSPSDYGAEGLTAQSKSLQSASAAAQASFDAALTLATMRFISDLRIGRINPKHLKFGIDVQSKKYDLPEFITQQVANAGNIQSVLDEIEPPYAGYRRIEDVLKQYLKLAAQGDGGKVPTGSKTVSPGDTYEGTAELAARLQLLGDLPQGGSFNSYSGTLVDGVKHFQERHGLVPDGKLGATTVRELNTPLSARIQEIDDALERWRWMPTEFQQPPVLVNIPEFRLRAYSEDHQLALSMRVVVGKAAPTQTPVFSDDIRFIVFRPYWNVPPGILRRNVIPGITKNSGYIARERFEVTDSSGRSVSRSEDLVDGLRSGKYSIRQKPGPNNALGLIKFMFPNSHSVYLHSTPSTELFARSRRDFSSGCIRVEKPAELAAFLLRNQPDGQQQWTVASVQTAMDSGRDNRQVNLTVKVPVLILYVTAVAEEDGTVHFFDDIYGHDKRLNALLAKGPPYP
ncbi:MAG TPA: L,D-transpeptidase family protein [Edaphobacter sp.]|jgi:murein L,D-transpeptidase YcbB/YkuD|nr:L,D-transpeptidase family protein [Edaphobacter sp.]